MSRNTSVTATSDADTGIRLYVTVADAAQMTSTSPDRIYDAIHGKQLRASNVGGTGRRASYRVKVRDLERWMEALAG